MDQIEHKKALAPLSKPETTNLLHPRVYGVIAGLAVWLVLSVWILFTGVGSTDYLLAIVGGFILLVVAFQFVLSRVRGTEVGEKRPSYRKWKSLNFDTWTGRLTGSQAAGEILLPIAAVAFGMTAFGIVLHLVEITST
jgi:hypothetical protein